MAPILLYIKIRGNMVALKSCEILDELKKLGITTTTDIIQYLRDYAAYSSPECLQPESEDD
jgi:hypothetical protein